MECSTSGNTTNLKDQLKRHHPVHLFAVEEIATVVVNQSNSSREEKESQKKAENITE